MSTDRSYIDDLIADGEDSAPWMVTYADMMTLLLVFFILLYTVFYFQTETFQQTLGAIEITVDDEGHTVSVLEYARELSGSGRKVRLEEATGLREKRLQMQREIREIAEANDWGENVNTRVEGRKLIITLDGGALFDSGLAGLTPRARQIFDNMLQTFRRYPDYSVKIFGHTDDVPISNNRFSSNWELSAVRATTVLRYLSDHDIDPRRLTATGYADLFPVAPNDTPDNRARNRRVEFVLEKEED